jgi:hypothetical protein
MMPVIVSILEHCIEIWSVFHELVAERILEYILFKLETPKYLNCIHCSFIFLTLGKERQLKSMLLTKETK